MASWFGAGCRPCSGANPEVDTVKVPMACSANADEFEAGMDVNEEALLARLEAERVAREEAEQERRKAEEARRRREEEEEAAAAAAAVAAAAEAEERRLRQEQEEQLAAEYRRRQQEAAAQQAREAEEQIRQRQAAEAKQQVQREAELKKVEEFLNSKSFTGINAKRKSFRKAKYPIHSVVKLNDTELAGLLVKHKADLTLKDSNNQTALSLAQKANKGGSHAPMINLLQAS